MHSANRSNAASGESAEVLNAGPLQQLAEAGQLGIDSLRREAIDLAARLEAGRFYVVCVGQFKRGKPSILNAPIGVPVIRTGVLRVTSAPTVIRYSPEPNARVRTICVRLGSNRT